MTHPEHWPDNLSGYKRTPEFTEITVPNALLRAHATKDNTWARLHVLEGKLRFHDEITDQEMVLSIGVHPCIFPGRVHHVTPDGAVRFFVEFCRPDPEGEIQMTEKPEDLPHRKL